MTEFITVEALVTFGGATAAAGAVTELLKPLLKKLPFEISPRIISFSRRSRSLPWASRSAGAENRRITYFAS